MVYIISHGSAAINRVHATVSDTVIMPIAWYAYVFHQILDVLGRPPALLGLADVDATGPGVLGRVGVLALQGVLQAVLVGPGLDAHGRGHAG